MRGLCAEYVPNLALPSANGQLRTTLIARLQDGTAAGTPLAVVDNCRALLRRCRPGVYLNKHQPQPPGSIADRNRLV
jgi:hypothetical protein